MIAFVQHFGLREAGGGSRILRALLEDAPEPYLSISTSARGPEELVEGREVHLPVRPYFGRIERSRFSTYLYRALSTLQLDEYFAQRFEQRLAALLKTRGATAVHAVAHSQDFWPSFRAAQRADVPYYLSIHDDPQYNHRHSPKLQETLERLGHVWRHAQGRTVISEAMGAEYCRRYGDRDYEVITDGLPEPMRDEIRPRHAARYRFYFLGAMHLTFHDNVYALEDALVTLGQRNGATPASLILRGSQAPMTAPRIHVDERPFAPEDVVQTDFDDVDILYLPLPFGEEYAPFRRFSMSTKLVTYLGSGLPIFYHGPADAAAARLLAEYDAAVQVNALDPEALLDGIAEVQDRRGELAQNALALGRERFRLRDQRERFWAMITSHQEQMVATAQPLPPQGVT